jgi:hypothetical protein
MAELESPGQCDGDNHSKCRDRQRRWNADSSGDLTPQNAAERHSAREYDHECSEPTGAHPRGQRHLCGDLKCRENRDPGDAGRQHGDCQQADVLDVSECEGRKRIEGARTRDHGIARDFRPHPGSSMAPPTAPMPMHVNNKP